MPRVVAALLLVASLFLVLPSPAHAQRVTQVSITANEVVYDPVGGKLYASVPGNAPAYANSVAVIDPATGAVENSVYVGSEPRKLAVSDDGKYLYVGIDGAFAVRRVDLATLTAGLQFGLGATSHSDPIYAEDIAVVPGDPSSVAVVRRVSGSSGDDGVAIYSNGVMRPVKTTTTIYGSRALAFGSAGRLYGYDNYTSGYEFFRMNVDASGVTVVDSLRELFTGYRVDFLYSNGLLYATSGRIVDPETRTVVGSLPLTPNDTYGYSRVAPEPATSTIYGILQTSSSSQFAIRAFDQDSQRVRWTLNVSGSGSGVTSFVTAGAARLAYSTSDGKVFVADLSGAQTLTVTKAGTGNGVVQSAPAGIDCNYRCATLAPDGAAITLTATPSTGSQFVRWEGDDDCADGSVTMSAPRTCRAVFAMATASSSVDLQLPVPANDLAYDAVSGRLFASVPGWHIPYGNGIVVVDPASGAVTDWLYVGSEPRRLALSDDGKKLYAGLDGARSVRPIDLSTMTAGQAFALAQPGQPPMRAGDIAVLPGDPSSVAVVRLDTNGYDEGVAVYTGGVIRPKVATSTYGIYSITFSASAGRLYGYNNESTAYNLTRMNLDDSGVTVVDDTWDVFSGFDIRIQCVDGRLYAGSGGILDPETLTPVGSLPSLGLDSPRAVVVDAAAGAIYSAGTSGDIRAFDLNTLRFQWLVDSTAESLSAFVGAGTGRVAYATATLHLVSFSSGKKLTVERAGAGSGSVTSAPAGIWCAGGHADCAELFGDSTAVTLTATPGTGSRFVAWQGDADCADGVVTMSAARRCTAVFAQLTNGLGLQLPLMVNDLAYSPLTGKLYASVPGSNSALGNSIAVIDPATGVVGASAWVGSEPNRLGISQDGATLYVGLNGSGAVRRVDLPSLTPGLQFTVGRDRYDGALCALDIAVMPGDANTVAIVRKSASTTGDAGTGIYTNGVLRAKVAGSIYSARSLAFSASPARLYGNDDGALVRMDVSSDGVTIADSTSLFTSSGRIVFDSGRLYENAGRVVDPESRTTVGTFTFTGNAYDRLVASDVAQGAVYFLKRSSYSSGFFSIARFDPATFTQVDAQTLTLSVSAAAANVSSFVLTGPGRMAFRSSDGVVLCAFGQAITDTVTIASTNPASGVPVTVDTPDADKLGSGVTPMLRTYPRGTVLTLTAPAAVGVANFYRWVNGTTQLSTSPTVAVTVSGPMTLSAQYRYPAPTVNSVAPVAGRASGGTVVTITGTGFQTGAMAYFAGIEAIAVTVLDATTLSAKTPALPAQVVPVAVRNPDGQWAVLAAAFTYYAAPTVTQASPLVGPITGGTTVTLTGTSFVAGATSITIGGQAAANVNVLSTTSLMFVTPPSVKGPATIVVSTEYGAGIAIATSFAYLAPPAITSIAPDHGPIGGGTTVTIAGQNFFAGAVVTLGRTHAVVTSVTDTEIQARTVSADAGAVDVTVTNADGESATLPAAFTFTGFRRYFAEGADNWFFDCTFDLVNPGADPANVTLRFLRGDGATFTHALVVPALSHRSVPAKSVEGLVPTGGFSTVLESDVEIVAERTMTWNGARYGSHAESAVKNPAMTWYLAEGATHSGFQLYYLIQNPNPEPIDVQVTYLLRAPRAPVERLYQNIPANSRTTIYVNADPDVAWSDVSGVVTSLTPDHPIIVERAMYLDNQGTQFNAGTDSAGVTAPATDWFLAEGATLGLFDMYVLLANPGTTSGTATLTYMLTDGRTLTKSYAVAARSRQTVWVNGEQGEGVDLSNVSLSTMVHADVPIIVERALWWPMGGYGAGWREGHNSVGATETGTAWVVAGGDQGGPDSADTYVLVANTSSFPGRARVTVLGEDGSYPPIEIDIPANSRTTVWMGGTARAPDSPFGGLLTGQRFGVVVESVPTTDGTAAVVVERATYSDAGGIHWAAGNGTVATKIR